MKKHLKHFFTGHSARTDNKFFILVMSLVGITVFLFTLTIGLKQSVWFDEAYSINVAQHSIREIMHFSAVDMHPPFFYLVLKLWAWLFGYSEIALRSLSAVCMAGAVIFAGLAGRRMFGARAGLAGMMMVVIAPMVLRFGFEIRMYALAALICSAATFVMIKAYQLSLEKRASHQKEAHSYWWVYSVLVALGMYTLYFTAFIWLAHLVWLIYMSKVRGISVKQTIKSDWAKAYGLSAALYLPWLPSLWSQSHSSALATVGQAMNIENLIGIISFNFVYSPTWKMNIYQSLLVLFVIITLVFVLRRAYKVSQHREMYMLAICLMAVPIIAMIGLTLFKPTYVERYLVHIVPVAMVCLGCLIWVAEQHKPSMVLRVSAGLLIVIQLVGLVNLISYGNYNFQRLERPTVKYLAPLMKEDCKKGATILANDPYVATELTYYLPMCVAHFHSDSAKLSGGYAPFSDSPMRVENPVPKQQGKILYYVYYGKPELKLDESYKALDRAHLGNMTVEKFSAE